MSLLYRLGAFFAPLKIIGEREKKLEALIDTGAFITGLSMEDCIEIRAEPSGTRMVKGIFGAALLPTFRCKIEVAGREFTKDVVGLPKPGAILGRDLLSNHIDKLSKLLIPQPSRRQFSIHTQKQGTHTDSNQASFKVFD